MTSSHPQKILDNPTLFADCPDWAKAPRPGWVEPYVNCFNRDEPIARQNAGISFWQANHNIRCREETEVFLYSDYSPTEIDYTPGLLPAYESVIHDFRVTGAKSDAEMALFLLHSVLPRIMPHNATPPVGWHNHGAFGFTDDELLAAGTGSCHQQTRVYIRLCQISGIPCRLVFLRYDVNAHTIAEYYANGKWVMADVTLGTVFPGPDGQPMSALECHRRDADYRSCYATACFERLQVLRAMPDLFLFGRRYLHLEHTAERDRKIAAHGARWRKEKEYLTHGYLAQHLDTFGLVNYPLPPADPASS